jgi:hypothetical protein
LFDEMVRGIAVVVRRPTHRQAVVDHLVLETAGMSDGDEEKDVRDARTGCWSTGRYVGVMNAKNLLIEPFHRFMTVLQDHSKSIRPILRYEINKIGILACLIIERFMVIGQFTFECRLRVFFTFEGNGHELSWQNIRIEGS